MVYAHGSRTKKATGQKKKRKRDKKNRRSGQKKKRQTGHKKTNTRTQKRHWDKIKDGNSVQKKTTSVCVGGVWFGGCVCGFVCCCVCLGCVIFFAFRVISKVSPDTLDHDLLASRVVLDVTLSLLAVHNDVPIVVHGTDGRQRLLHVTLL